jgi:prepilin-type N-terminal cleavage/methylation domain-containing protein
MRKTGFTVLELAVVMIILGILATLGFVQYGTYKESTLDKEAQANLRLIVAAERVYRMEIGGFFACSDATCINGNLRMLLSPANWSYLTTATLGTATCAQATRTSGTVRNWRLRQNETDPVSGACP